MNAATVQTDRFEQMNTLCQSCAQDDITSIVMGGGPLAGLSQRITTGRRIAIIDGTQSAIGLLRGPL